MKFKFILILQFVVLHTFAAFDPPSPYISVKITNKSSFNIDSVLISNTADFKSSLTEFDSYIADSKESHEYDTVGMFENSNNMFRLKVKLSNNTTILSDVIYEKNKRAYFTAYIYANKITIKKDYSNVVKKLPLLIIYIILISYFFKVHFLSKRFQLKNKTTYSIKYTLINILYISFIYFIFNFGIESGFVYVFYIIVIITPILADNLFHQFDKNIIKYSEKTLSILNFLFFSVGILFFGFLWTIIKLLLGFPIFS